MNITHKPMPRRTFLRGMGATVALPLLDAMIPARSVFAASASPARMAFVYFPHGAVMSEWAPGDGAALGRILEPLSPFKDRLTIVSGLENRHAAGPVHALAPGTWLSGAPPRSGDSSGEATADQIAARHLGRDTSLPSIQVATEEPSRICAGVWDRQYADGYGTTVSFTSPSAPLPMEFRPREVFNRLFAQEGTVAAGTASARDGSILDRVSADVSRVRQRLGLTDRARLGRYLDTIRDVERRVAGVEAFDREMAACGSPHAGGEAFDARLNLTFDMIALAFQSDMTRVASFMMTAETSQMTYDHLGISEAFHPLSHHQHDPAKIDKLVQIQRYHTRAVARFVQTLADLPDGDGSVLDHSQILYGSNMSDGYAHDHFPLPAAVIGGACGRIRGGRHVRCEERTPLSNLLVTMLDRAGVPVRSIGDSTGDLTDV